MVVFRESLMERFITHLLGGSGGGHSMVGSGNSEESAISLRSTDHLIWGLMV